MKNMQWEYLQSLLNLSKLGVFSHNFVLCHVIYKSGELHLYFSIEPLIFMAFTKLRNLLWDVCGLINPSFSRIGSRIWKTKFSLLG